MNLKKYWEMYLPVNLLGPGPLLIKKKFTGLRSHEGNVTQDMGLWRRFDSCHLWVLSLVNQHL